VPRYLYNTKPLLTSVKQERAKDFQVKGTKRWIDPFVMVHGTLPEKMVYEALSRRGIPFYFLNDVTINIPELNILKDYQADFLIPSLNLIIEVQGAYWHSKPKTVEADAFKFALYEQMGYKVLAWWDFDIIENVNKLFLQEPMLRPYGAIGNKSTELAPKKRTKVDTSKGIRTLNKRRGDRLLYRKPSVKIKPSKKVKGVRTFTANAGK
jgi:G:T-mismatch repair DNA endonuclease (very short patch repair protein)